MPRIHASCFTAIHHLPAPHPSDISSKSNEIISVPWELPAGISCGLKGEAGPDLIPACLCRDGFSDTVSPGTEDPSNSPQRLRNEVQDTRWICWRKKRRYYLKLYRAVNKWMRRDMYFGWIDLFPFFLGIYRQVSPRQSK